jgi:hypothetical protein
MAAVTTVESTTADTALRLCMVNVRQKGLDDLRASREGVS